MAAIATAICGSGSGQAAGCMEHDIPILRPGRGKEQAADKIMAIGASRIEYLARRFANKPPGSAAQTKPLGDAAIWDV